MELMASKLTAVARSSEIKRHRRSQRRVFSCHVRETFDEIQNLTSRGQSTRRVGATRPFIQTKRRTMDRKTLTGAVLAAAVGAMFLTSPVFAQDSSSGSMQASVKC